MKIFTARCPSGATFSKGVNDIFQVVQGLAVRGFLICKKQLRAPKLADFLIGMPFGVGGGVAGMLISGSLDPDSWFKDLPLYVGIMFGIMLGDIYKRRVSSSQCAADPIGKQREVSGGLDLLSVICITVGMAAGMWVSHSWFGPDSWLELPLQIIGIGFGYMLYKPYKRIVDLLFEKVHEA